MRFFDSLFGCVYAILLALNSCLEVYFEILCLFYKIKRMIHAFEADDSVTGFWIEQNLLLFHQALINCEFRLFCMGLVRFEIFLCSSPY